MKVLSSQKVINIINFFFFFDSCGLGPILLTFPSIRLSTQKFKNQNQNNNKKTSLKQPLGENHDSDNENTTYSSYWNWAATVFLFGRYLSYKLGLESGWELEDLGQWLHEQASHPHILGFNFHFSKMKKWDYITVL